MQNFIDTEIRQQTSLHFNLKLILQFSITMTHILLSYLNHNQS